MSGMMLDMMDKFIGVPTNDFQLTIEYIGAMLFTVMMFFIILWVFVRIGEKLS